MEGLIPGGTYEVNGDCRVRLAHGRMESEARSSAVVVQG